LETAGSALDSFAKEMGLEGDLVLYRLNAQWERLFKGLLSDHTRPCKFSEGRLLVLADSPVWIQQLNFLKSDMLEKLRGFGVKDIRYKLGAVRKRRDRPAAPSRPVTGPDSAFIDGLLLDVRSPELKASIRRAVEKSLTSSSVRRQ
jgi:predicted nucleic acid-binding Zn ribbon protein